MYVVWVLAAASFFTAGGVAMKASAGMTRLTPTLLLFLLFAIGATFQALALRYAELGVAYVVVLGLEAVFAVALGVLIFSEQLSALKWVDRRDPGDRPAPPRRGQLHRGSPRDRRTQRDRIN